MLEITLAKGYFVSREGKRRVVVPITDIESPVLYDYHIGRHVSRLPDIELVYRQLVCEGKTEENIIQTLLCLYLPIKVFRLGPFERMQLVIGFVGSRGSGKSCGMAAIAILEWLLRGQRVWSNMPIGIKVKYGDCQKVFTSEPLEQLDLLDLEGGLYGGLAVVDEANMSVAEANRASSSANLDFSYAIQQIRKRGLSVLWTCQGFGWVDNRLRWQTDFVVTCRDEYLINAHPDGLGARSEWRVSDLSGMTGRFGPDYALDHRYINQFEVARVIFRNKPFWGSYDTGLLQGSESYIRKYKLAKAGQTREFEHQLVEARQKPAQGIVNSLLEQGIEEFLARDLWEKYGITDNRPMQTQIGSLLQEYYEKKPSREGNLYRLKK